MSERSVVRWVEGDGGRPLRFVARLPGEIPGTLATPQGLEVPLHAEAVTAAGGLCACVACVAASDQRSIPCRHHPASSRAVISTGRSGASSASSRQALAASSNWPSAMRR